METFQIILGILFSAIGIYFPVFKGAPPWLYMFFFIGLTLLANGFYSSGGNSVTRNSIRIPAWIVGIPISLLFFFAAYQATSSNVAVSAKTVSIGPAALIFGTPVISAAASKYALVFGFIVAGLFPWIFSLGVPYLKSRNISILLAIYALASLIIMFPAFYMLLFENNGGSMPIIYVWVLVTIAFYLKMKLNQKTIVSARTSI